METVIIMRSVMGSVMWLSMRSVMGLAMIVQILNGDSLKLTCSQLYRTSSVAKNGTSRNKSRRMQGHGWEWLRRQKSFHQCAEATLHHLLTGGSAPTNTRQLDHKIATLLNMRCLNLSPVSITWIVHTRFFIASGLRTRPPSGDWRCAYGGDGKRWQAHGVLGWEELLFKRKI